MSVMYEWKNAASIKKNPIPHIPNISAGNSSIEGIYRIFDKASKSREYCLTSQTCQKWYK